MAIFFNILCWSKFKPFLELMLDVPRASLLSVVIAMPLITKSVNCYAITYYSQFFLSFLAGRASLSFTSFCCESISSAS